MIIHLFRRFFLANTAYIRARIFLERMYNPEEKHPMWFCIKKAPPLPGELLNAK
jgi:hypothetical protein